MMVIAFISTELPVSAQCVNTEQFAGVLIAGIMIDGMSGSIMRRRSLILN